MKLIPQNKTRLVKLIIFCGLAVFLLLAAFVFVNSQFLYDRQEANCDLKVELHPDGTIWCNLGQNCNMIDCTDRP